MDHTAVEIHMLLEISVPIRNVVEIGISRESVFGTKIQDP